MTILVHTAHHVACTSLFAIWQSSLEYNSATPSCSLYVAIPQGNFLWLLQNTEVIKHLYAIAHNGKFHDPSVHRTSASGQCMAYHQPNTLTIWTAAISLTPLSLVCLMLEAFIPVAWHPPYVGHSFATGVTIWSFGPFLASCLTDIASSLLAAMPSLSFYFLSSCINRSVIFGTSEFASSAVTSESDKLAA